jgi:hypothetical protein
VTGLALAKLGKRGVLSAALGAVAARLVGLKEAGVRSAVAQELREVSLSASTIEQNLALALECFQSVPDATLTESVPAEAPPAPLWTPQYETPGKGSPRITARANAPLRGTGDWRTFRPVLDPEKCNGCWLCFADCWWIVLPRTRMFSPR